MESKRSQQWFTDNAEADLFPHKKQAIEVQSCPSFLGIPNSNVAQWGNSGFHTVTGQFTERLFAADSIRTINFDDRHITSTDCGNINVGRKNTDDPFGDDSSFGLSISHTVNDPKSGVNYSGIRKVKVSQVKDSDSILPMSMGQAFMNGDPHAINVAQAYSKPDVNSIPTDLPFGKSHGDTDILSAGNAFHQENNNFISMGQPFNKGSGISIHQDYRPNDNTVSMNPSFGTGVSTIMPVFQIYTKGQDTGITNYPTSTDNLTLRGHPYSKENESQIQLSHDMFNEDETSVPGANSYKKENNILMGNLYNKGDSNILPFGNYEDEANTGGRVICNYDLVMGQPPVEKPTAVTHDETAKHLADVAGSAHQVASESGTPPKKKDSKTNKKDPPNSFPSNVRSLLSTGILDGVPVKYVAWSREVL